MSKKILVADDSSTIRGVAESLLRQKGYEVFSAPDGETALSMIEKNKPDLMMLDYSMPEPNGVTLCRQLREMDEYKDIPILILTNSLDDDHVVDFVESGATDTLSKPFTPRELSDIIDGFLSADPKDDAELGDSNIQIRHNLLGPENENNIKPPAIDLSEDSEPLPRKPVEDFSIQCATSDSRELESLLPSREDDDFDFSWSDLSLDNEEFIDQVSDARSFEEHLMAEPSDDAESDSVDSVSLFIDNYDFQGKGDSETPHDYDWFISEMRKEIKKPDTSRGESQKKKSPESTASGPEPKPVHSSDKYNEFVSAFKEGDDKNVPEKQETEEDQADLAEIEEINRQFEQADTGEADGSSAAPVSEPEPETGGESESVDEPPKIPREVLSDMANRLAVELAEKLARQITSQLDDATLERLIRENLAKTKSANSVD